MTLMRFAALVLFAATTLACGKLANEDEDNDADAGADADAAVECTPVDRGDQCATSTDCPRSSVCFDSERFAPTYTEECSDGTFRGTTDSSPIRLCGRCEDRSFREECSYDEECPEGSRCVDSGERMPSSSVVCPDGTGGGSSDARVVHECRADDGG